MHYDTEDTIAAIGTAAGGAPRGMVRLSGPRVLDCLASCFQPSDATDSLAIIKSPSLVTGAVSLASGATLPCDLFLWPNERSYTRQPTAELHTLGSPPLLEQLLRTVCDCGARLAEPGEFTLRAFLAGRLDLTQAEAVLGVIDAGTSTDLHNALAQLAGGLSDPLATLRHQLLQLLAELEAGLDFAEEDIEFISAEQLRQQITAAQSIVAEAMEQLTSREDASALPRIVLSGPPNVGKSSLFNALVERFGPDTEQVSALVSAQAGTTRDFVSAVIGVRGIACELIDTAGVEADWEANSIDQLAQAGTGKQREQADIVVHCKDASVRDVCQDAFDVECRDNEILAWTKSDLLSTKISPHSPRQIVCSSVTGEGFDQLVELLRELLETISPETNKSLQLTASRCAQSLEFAATALSRALGLVNGHGGEELIAAEVRGALDALGQVVGTVYTDDILDRIFGQFCIGK